MSDGRHVVILAGGSGTRLWPRSRESRPKHVLALHGKQSLLQTTYERVRELSDAVYVVTERSQVPLIKEQLPDLDKESFLIEPARRGTAAALGMAAILIQARDPQALMISVHADHHLGPDAERYRQTLAAEAEWAESSGALVTVGLKPPYPSTGLGYIEVGERVEGKASQPAYRVRRFVEKPDLATAERYVASGRYFWHLGLFSWRVQSLLDEIARVDARLRDGLQRYAEAWKREDAGAAEKAYLELKPEPIDTAVLEKTSNLLMVSAQFEWHDVGSWADLHDILEQDEAGNFIEGDYVLVDTRDCMIHAPGKLVAAVGLEGMVVIETEDALLICPKTRSQEVRTIVERLKQMGKTEYL